MNRNLSLRIIQRGLGMVALLLSAVAVSADTHVTFQVDMSAQISAGTFNPATDSVFAQGSFNGWGHLNLAASSVTNVYTNSVDDTADANGTVMSYKFGDTQQNYEDPLAEGNNWNRVASLPASSGASLSLPYTYFDDAGPATSYNITFQVDMAEPLNAGYFTSNDNVYCQGWFEGWNDSFQLTNNPALNVVSNGNLISCPYQGTYTSWSVSQGEQSDFKYVYNNGGDNYENVSTPNANPNSGNRFFFNENGTLPLVNFGDVAWTPNVTNYVTFEVDMTALVNSGAFIPGASTLTLNGDFNGWGSTPTPMTNNPASPNTNIYSVEETFIGAPGSSHAFKYVENGTYESLANNREMYLQSPSGDYTNGPVYFNNQSPNMFDFIYATNCMVTFTVDMTNATGTGTGGTESFDNQYPSGDTIWINGLFNGVVNSFWGWGGLGQSGYLMTQIPNTFLFTITLPVNKGQPADLIYKYSINGIDDEAGFADNHERWVRSQPDYTMPVDVYASQGSSTESEIPFGDLTISNAGNNQVQLSWLGRPGVHLQTTSSLNGPWTDQYLTDGTNLIVAPGGMASTNYTVGAGSLFYRLVGPQ